MRVLIADDHNLILRGLRHLLTSQPGWHVVAEAANGAQAVRKARLTAPDVVVLDLYMPELTGIEAAGEIRRLLPAAVIIILTMQDSPVLRQQALDRGASELLLKTAADETLVAAILHAMLQRSPNRLSRPGKSAALLSPRLTNRESEVMQLLATGSTSRDISVLLGISVRTVESHRTNLNTKFGFHTLADLVRFNIKRDADQSIHASPAPL